MATNTMVLMVVATFAALVLTSALALVAFKTRTQDRHSNGQTIRDQAEEIALRPRRQEALADEFETRANAAQVEVDIKTVRRAPAAASDGVSKRSGHLPRPTERGDGPSARWMTAAT